MGDFHGEELDFGFDEETELVAGYFCGGDTACEAGFPAEGGIRVDAAGLAATADNHDIAFIGLELVADAPSAYVGQAGWDFGREVPTTWDETRVLEERVGDYIVMARRLCGVGRRV
ncbi:MAG: hypothetical protein RI897_1489 [Verrucomicrobiota bacterium]